MKMNAWVLLGILKAQSENWEFTSTSNDKKTMLFVLVKKNNSIEANEIKAIMGWMLKHSCKIKLISTGNTFSLICSKEI